MLRNENNNLISTSAYYIVLKPIVYKTLNDAEVSSILNKIVESFPKSGDIYIYTDKEQAKFSASQFASREVPKMFNKNRQFAKPVLCLHLNNPIELKEPSESCFFGPNGLKKLVSYKASVTDLKQWQDSEWSVLIDGNELFKNQASQSNNTSKQEERHEKCLMM